MFASVSAVVNVLDTSPVVAEEPSLNAQPLDATLVNTSDSTKSVAFSVDPDATVTLNASGLGSFDIGGSITVLSSTVDGDYAGTVDVTVSYL